MAPPPVVLVHGSRVSRTMWRVHADALRRLGVCVSAPDLPGHGTRRGERFRMDAAVDAVRSAIDGLGGRAVVAGLSLGGYVGIEHRARYPEQSLALVAAACSTSPRSPLRVLWLRAAQGIDALPDGGAALNRLVIERSLTPWAAQDMGAGGFAVDVMTDILREVGECDSLRSLAAAASPVWFVNGRWDHFRGDERAFVAAARSTGADARLRVVPHARHLVSLDAPVAFSRVLLDVLDSVDCPHPWQVPGTGAADEGRGVRDDDHVVAEPVEDAR